MYGACAELLTLATIPIGLFTLTYTFVWRAWHFLPSFLAASLLVVPLLCIAILCEHRDAAVTGQQPRSFFPSRQGFVNFLFVALLILLCGLYTFGFFAIAISLGGGDTWSDAWTRLAFCVVAILLAWQLQFWTTSLAHRWFSGLVYDDWLESLGKPISWRRIRRFLVYETSTPILITFAVLGVAVVWFGVDWISPFWDFEASRASRARKLQAAVRWLVQHPNTVSLFASTLVVASVGLLLCKAATDRHRKTTKEHNER